MKMWHIVIVAIIFYFIGSYYGSYGQAAVNKVTSLV